MKMAIVHAAHYQASTVKTKRRFQNFVGAHRLILVLAFFFLGRLLCKKFVPFKQIQETPCQRRELLNQTSITASIGWHGRGSPESLVDLSFPASSQAE